MKFKYGVIECDDDVGLKQKVLPLQFIFFGVAVIFLISPSFPAFHAQPLWIIVAMLLLSE